MEGGKSENQEKIPRIKEGTNIKLNPHANHWHRGGGQVLSPPCQPCSPRSITAVGRDHLPGEGSPVSWHN